ncbi:NifB/NifX family molybdenum-iron cluster-binding protein [Thermovenabulum gondwanense]|uniref:Dinitrogenase iron-molybdenum cofactor biosynthesis domain-containing protein n=1 Tax=Thermovenabulum gondwanense TaxID=520767 RepID=A0A162MZ67_9FIRM|nr:NifB/NifX family molybdenum-iron cluster-binding protein [Thermovenabulum gondwanense]KYO68588.1 hypothetical protein ATZ99_00970 [Thermovenabulum gondwanense]
MLIAVTSTGNALDSFIDERFGRCKYFIIINPQTKEYEAIENEYSNSAHGTGVQVAQFIVDKGVSAIITGYVGPNAISILNEAGIEIYSANSISVKEALENYFQGKLHKVSSPIKPHKNQ